MVIDQRPDNGLHGGRLMGEGGIESPGTILMKIEVGVLTQSVDTPGNLNDMCAAADFVYGNSLHKKHPFQICGHMKNPLIFIRVFVCNERVALISHGFNQQIQNQPDGSAAGRQESSEKIVSTES
jgi:hypothetical protein